MGTATTPPACLPAPPRLPALPAYSGGDENTPPPSAYLLHQQQQQQQQTAAAAGHHHGGYSQLLLQPSAVAAAMGRDWVAALAGVCGCLSRLSLGPAGEEAVVAAVSRHVEALLRRLALGVFDREVRNGVGVVATSSNQTKPSGGNGMMRSPSAFHCLRPAAAALHCSV